MIRRCRTVCRFWARCTCRCRCRICGGVFSGMWCGLGMVGENVVVVVPLAIKQGNGGVMF